MRIRQSIGSARQSPFDRQSWCIDVLTIRLTAAKKSAGQGRPIGSLIAWLMAANKHAGQHEHVKAKVATQAVRMEARIFFFQECAGARTMESYERPKRDGEESEPEDIQ